MRAPEQTADGSAHRASGMRLALPEGDPVPVGLGGDLIATFKAKRERRQKLAKRWLITAGLTVWMTCGFLPDLLISGSDDNKFRRHVNTSSGVEEMQLTSAGQYLYSGGWFLSQCGICVVALVPHDVDEALGSVHIVAIFRGREKVTFNLLFVLLVFYSYCNGPLVVIEKYGWISAWPHVVGFGWVLLYPPGFGFAAWAKDMPALPYRQITASEFSAWFFLSCLLVQYTTMDVYCLWTGQWAQKSVGFPGGVAVIILCLGIFALWLHMIGRHVISRDDTAGGIPRTDLFQVLYLSSNIAMAAQQIIHGLVLWPDQPANAGLDTYAGQRVGGWIILGCAYGVAPGLCLFRRKQIYAAATRPLRRQQKLLDGAFIAALLAADDTNDILAEGRSLLRRVPFSALTKLGGADIFRDSAGSAELFEVSESCSSGDIDFFVSHSWLDDADTKFAQLSAVAAEFRTRHSREPTLWLDKLCIDQSDIQRALRCLPVFVQSCQQLLIMCGDTYCNRLWCVWELYIYFAMSGDHGNARLVDFSTTNQGTRALLADFDVRNAHCHSQDDETRLRRIIDSEGISDFNLVVRELAQTVGGPEAATVLNPIGDGTQRGAADNETNLL